MEGSVNFLLQICGAGACVGVAVLVYRDSLRWWRRCQRLQDQRTAERKAFRDQVAITAQQTRLQPEYERAWEDYRKLRVVAIVEECRDIKSFYLADPDGRALPEFLPGQHLTVQLPTEGTKSPTVRCYSLSDVPRDESYRLSIKRCGPPPNAPEAPEGVGSCWIHDNVRVGDELNFGPPSGDFYLDMSSQSPIVLIAGGIGITPIISMALQLALRGIKRETYLILAMRGAADFPFRQVVEELRGISPRLQVFVAFSEAEEGDIKGRDFQHKGYVDIDFLRSVLPSNNYDFYVCGPPPMMQTLVPGLYDWGVPDERVHFEAFGPASVPRRSDEDLAADAVGLQVKFARRKEEVCWPENCQTILELAEQFGIPMESGCRVGNCGQCATPIVEGSIKTVKRPGAIPPPDHCLTCISVPTSPLILDV